MLFDIIIKELFTVGSSIGDAYINMSYEEQIEFLKNNMEVAERYYEQFKTIFVKMYGNGIAVDDSFFDSLYVLWSSFNIFQFVGNFHNPASLYVIDNGKFF